MNFYSTVFLPVSTSVGNIFGTQGCCFVLMGSTVCLRVLGFRIYVELGLGQGQGQGQGLGCDG